MRKKIKELMNKEEGFTLVELLAVIVILGLIIAIAVPAIGSIMDDAKTNTDAATNTLVEDAARLYDVENEIDLTTGITVAELVQAGYLDVRDAEDLSGTVTKEAGTTTTTVEGVSSDTPTKGFTYTFDRD